MSNRLSQETSPYLRQHGENPVDWYPWGEEALMRAKRERKPILLSIGYSACHWCHVMEHECFENAGIARLMNENFVSIKVDREERPDLDQIYQIVAQAITRGGGWPLTVFLTPELEPFYGGTYFPPEDLWGRPGFPRLLEALARAYREEPASVAENARGLLDVIRHSSAQAPEEGALPTAEGLAAAASALLAHVDWQNGGIGGAPKFPNPMMLDFLWRHGLATADRRASEAAVLTLTRMASGGIYDQLGGGFHRYSVDETWSVPHFEKMLYDNALLLRSYSQVLLAGGVKGIDVGMSEETRALFVRVVSETVEYLLREMLSPEGAFFAAQDADSEGEEGKFFAWSLSDLKGALTHDEAQVFALRYGVTEEGNFEHGKTVLFLAQPEAQVAEMSGKALKETRALLTSAKHKLFQKRRERVAPATDGKILTSWNGLVVSGLAWASQALRESGETAQAERALRAAVNCFEFLSLAVGTEGSRLKATFKDGVARFNGYLDDYAFLSMAAIDLARFEPEAGRAETRLSQAERWIEVITRHFGDASQGGYFFTSDDHEALIHRPKTNYDQAIPSGTAVALNCLVALAEMDLAGRGLAWSQEAERQLSALWPEVKRSPYGHGELLNSAALALASPWVISGLRSERVVFHPWIFRKDGSQEKIVVCRNKTCAAPVSEVEALQELREQLFSGISRKNP